MVQPASPNLLAAGGNSEGYDMAPETRLEVVEAAVAQIPTQLPLGPFQPAWAALDGGLLLGGPLALIGLHLTRFETTAAGKFYIPNTAIGVALTVLFVGRVGYRMFVLFGSPPATDQPPPALFQSPLTLLIFGLTAGYYIAYSAGLLRLGSKLV